MVSHVRAARRRHPSSRPLACALLALTLFACKREDDVREWRASDHDRADEPNPGQAAPAPATQAAASPGMPSLQSFGISDVVLTTWKQSCTPCHGIIGRGDGPQGPMMRPPDFTHPVWQKAALDDQMQHAIKKGKGRMPPFAHLPDDTVEGLVKLVRLLNRERPVTPPPAASGAPAPESTGSAAKPPQGAVQPPAQAPAASTPPAPTAAPPPATEPAAPAAPPAPRP